MKIGVFDPYLDTLGGGEKYILTAASYLSNQHIVKLFWDDEAILSQADKRFDFSLKKIILTKNIFTRKNTLLTRILVTKNLDTLFYLSDGSIPWLFSKNNILLFQFPVYWVNGKSIINRLKLKNIHTIICYSEFVKKYLVKNFDKNIVVVPPPISLEKIKPLKKENIILSVGRFTKAMNAKKQQFLIDSFISMQKKGLSGWKLVLIGAYLPQDKDFVDKIKQIAKGYPIDILTNVSFAILNKYYGQAKIYWHATGFGENLQQNPERAEHFGIATVEAMAAGAVPVVINAGGQPEIIDHGRDGFLWQTQEEMIQQTSELIKNEKKLQLISKESIKKSKCFSTEIFCKKISSIISI